MLDKPIKCSGSSWEVTQIPLCTSPSHMGLFPKCQIPRILAAEWVQNLTCSETRAYRNLLSLNSWRILGALMCKAPWRSRLASALGLVSAHTRIPARPPGAPTLLPSPCCPFPCSTWGGASQRPAHHGCPQLTLEPAELVQRHDNSAKASPGGQAALESDNSCAGTYGHLSIELRTRLGRNTKSRDLPADAMLSSSSWAAPIPQLCSNV